MKRNGESRKADDALQTGLIKKLEKGIRRNAPSESRVKVAISSLPRIFKKKEPIELTSNKIKFRQS